MALHEDILETPLAFAVPLVPFGPFALREILLLKLTH